MKGKQQKEIFRGGGGGVGWIGLEVKKDMKLLKYVNMTARIIFIYYITKTTFDYKICLKKFMLYDA